MIVNRDMTLKMEQVKVGDWIRFWKGGNLVIGVVQYPPYRDICGPFQIPTDAGITSATLVVEIRSLT